MTTSPFVVSSVANSSSATRYSSSVTAYAIDPVMGLKKHRHRPARRQHRVISGSVAAVYQLGTSYDAETAGFVQSRTRSSMSPMGSRAAHRRGRHRGGTVGLLKSKGRVETAKDRVRPYAAASSKVVPWPARFATTWRRQWA